MSAGEVEIISTLEDQVVMPVALDQLKIVSGAQALGGLLEEVLVDNTPVGSLMVDIDVDGHPKAVKWVITTKDAGAVVKFETHRLFPEAATADNRCKVTSLLYNGASFAFSPGSWTSDWVEASVLKV